jgi:hypothetical protein
MLVILNIILSADADIGRGSRMRIPLYSSAQGSSYNGHQQSPALKCWQFCPLHNFMKILQLFESYKIIGGEYVFRIAFSKRKRLQGQVNSPRGQTVPLSPSLQLPPTLEFLDLGNWLVTSQVVYTFPVFYSGNLYTSLESLENRKEPKSLIVCSATEQTYACLTCSFLQFTH